MLDDIRVLICIPKNSLQITGLRKRANTRCVEYFRTGKHYNTNTNMHNVTYELTDRFCELKARNKPHG